MTHQILSRWRCIFIWKSHRKTFINFYVFSPQGAVCIPSNPNSSLGTIFISMLSPLLLLLREKNEILNSVFGWQAQKPKFRAQTPFPCPGCDHCCCYIIDCPSPQVSNLFPCDTCLTAVLWQWESGISWLHYSLKLQFSQWQCIVWVSSRPAQNLRVLKLLKNDCDWVPWQWAWWEPKTMEDCGLLWLTVNYVTMNWWPICEVRCISLRCESM